MDDILSFCLISPISENITTEAFPNKQLTFVIYWGHHDKWGQTVLIESLNPVLMVTWSARCPLSAWCCIITHSALVFTTYFTSHCQV